MNPIHLVTMFMTSLIRNLPKRILEWFIKFEPEKYIRNVDTTSHQDVVTFYVQFPSKYIENVFLNDDEKRTLMLNFIMKVFNKNRDKFLNIDVMTYRGKQRYMIADGLKGIIKTCELTNISEYTFISKIMEIIHDEDNDEFNKRLLIHSVRFLSPYSPYFSQLVDRVHAENMFEYVKPMFDAILNGDEVTMVCGPGVSYSKFDGYRRVFKHEFYNEGFHHIGGGNWVSNPPFIGLAAMVQRDATS